MGIRAARRELAKLQTEVDEGKHGGQRATPGFFLDEWLKHGRARGRPPSTIYGCESEVRRIKAGPLTNKSATKLTAHDLDTWYAELRASGTSQATIVHFHSTIPAALNQAEKWAWVTRNPAKFATVARSPAPEMHVPTVEQARVLVMRAAKTNSPDLAAVILFAVLTGARRGELAGKRWSDVDWDARRLTFRRSVYQADEKLGTKDPKTHQVRTIALDPMGIKLLSARRRPRRLHLVT